MLLVHLNDDKKIPKELANRTINQNKQRQVGINHFGDLTSLSIENKAKNIDLMLALDLDLPRRKRKTGISR